MRAAIIVARELLHCRLAEGGHDTLLEQVAELLDAASRGAEPFCSLSMPQVVAEAGAGPRRARAPPGAPEGFDSNNMALGVVRPAATAPPAPRGHALVAHCGAALGRHPAATRARCSTQAKAPAQPP